MLGEGGLGRAIYLSWRITAAAWTNPHHGSKLLLHSSRPRYAHDYEAEGTRAGLEEVGGAISCAGHHQRARVSLVANRVYV